MTTTDACTAVRKFLSAFLENEDIPFMMDSSEDDTVEISIQHEYYPRLEMMLNFMFVKRATDDYVTEKGDVWILIDRF